MIHGKTPRREIEWHFSPSLPGATHIDEAHGIMFKATKKKIVCRSSLQQEPASGGSDVTDEELITVATGSESLLIYQQALKVSLTPNHFLSRHVGEQFTPNRKAICVRMRASAE